MIIKKITYLTLLSLVILGSQNIYGNTIKPKVEKLIQAPNIFTWPNGRVPICFNSQPSYREIQWVKDSLAQSWAAAAKISFVYSNTCPFPSNIPHIQLNFIELSDSWGSRGVSDIGVKNPTITNVWYCGENTPAEHACYPGGANATDYEESFRSVVIHEIGHALGFIHEQQRLDATPICNVDINDSNSAKVDGLLLTSYYDHDSIMNYCRGWDGHTPGPYQRGYRGSDTLSLGDIEGVQKAYGRRNDIQPQLGGLLVSDANPSLAVTVNRYNVLTLVRNASRTNTNGLLSYYKGMLRLSKNQNLAVYPQGGARNKATLRLVNNCTPNNPTCTWTYHNGLLLNDRDPRLAINAYGGAREGGVLRLVDNCSASNSDCTWTYRNVSLHSDTNKRLLFNAYGGAKHGTIPKLVNDCYQNNPDCTWTYSKGMLFSDRNPVLALNAYGGAKDGTIPQLVDNCPSHNPDCTWTYSKGVLFSDSDPNLALNAYGGAKVGTIPQLVNNCPPDHSDCTWSIGNPLSLITANNPKDNRDPLSKDDDGLPAICNHKPNLPQCNL